MGAFRAAFAIPAAPALTSPAAVGHRPATRSSGMTVTWTRGASNAYVQIQTQGPTDSSDTNGAIAVCNVAASAGTFTIPPDALPENPDLAAAVPTEANYFDRHAERMRYPQFRKQSLFVGFRRYRGRVQNRDGLQPQALGHVLNRPRSQRRHSAPLLPSQPQVRRLLGATSRLTVICPLGASAASAVRHQLLPPQRAAFSNRRMILKSDSVSNTR